MKNDLDSMLEDFLMENHVEDNGFSKKVMEQIPAAPKWLWLRDAAPALALGALGFIAWSNQHLIMQSLFMYRSEFYQWLGEQLGSSITISYTALGAVGVVMAYFLVGKIMHEIENF